MKVAFISTAFPADLKQSVIGVHKRMGMFIHALKELGELDMLFFVSPDLALSESAVAEAEKRLQEHWRARIRLTLCPMAQVNVRRSRWHEYIGPALSIKDHSPYTRTAQSEQVRAVNRLLSQNPDVVFVHRLCSMVPLLLSGAHHSHIYFDLDDIEHIAFARSIRQPPHWFGKWLYYLRLPILKHVERRAVEVSAATFVCSEHDKQYLSKSFGCDNVLAIPNAVNLTSIKDLPEKPSLLFIGVMSYGPNSVAADHLIKNIWPLIYRVIPEARLLVAGASPESIPSYSENNPGVEFLGFVDDLEQLYKEVKVVCCPILSGGGTRIKILEAAAHGKPVVSTTVGAEGIAFTDGEEIYLRDDPRSFADACIMLLKDRQLSARVGSAAREVVATHYDKNVITDQIKAFFVHQLER